ncbi:complex I subunit 4 family protein [Azospira restricta]|uniref:NADH-quinone oxidoreductase subunit L n=1 Tax=Azospira restricta TaxID=404405 RepID=A0A974SP56_9RHOO|nr:proton-conducting transporter membrane subunit [Azospira restricta]QRJ63865.1 NADH-quinone oxidoreductase subunit L [Azospira restricta]
MTPVLLEELHWTRHAGLPLLALLQLLPLAGAVVLHALRRRPWAVALARGVFLGELLLAVLLYRGLDASSAALQFAERADWLAYHAGADGVTALFVLVAALIGLLLSLYEPARERMPHASLLVVILLAQAALMTMLVTVNLLWFAAASAFELALVAYLLRVWAAGDAGDLAFSRFLQYQGFGWLLFAGGVLVLGWGHADATGGLWSFDLFDLALTPPLGRFQSAAFFLLFYGLAVRTPLFPLHGWLPDMAQHGTIAIAPTLMLGIKVGIYGMLRYVLPLTPDAVLAWQPYVVAFAGAGVFFTAALALLQTNLRRLLGFAVVSHTSLIVIGLFTLHPLGVQGALLLAVNFGFAVTVLLLMVAFVFKRTHTAELAELGGLFERIPFIAIAFLIGGFSIVGMPGTPGFDAAHLVLEAAIERFGALPTVATALGNVAAAGFLLWAFQRAFLAPAPDGGERTAAERVRPMEYLLGGLTLFVLLAAGFLPEPWLQLTEAATQAAAARFGGG